MLITPDEARRIAANIAKLLTPLKRRHVAKATHGAGMIGLHRAWQTCVRERPHRRALISHMETSTQYRELAEQCKWLAGHIETERHRSVLKEMAEAWKELADEADRRDQY